MESWTVTCAACEVQWARIGGYSDYERQAVEAQPCPGCGKHTLVCREPVQNGRRAAARGARPQRRAA
ncbi:hypothetical protein [Gemmata sp.]|uniref:hypothetical protein n=1 Tax=Gemmata sp. TaxID=1914242 RepID=UPI003F704413